MRIPRIFQKQPLALGQSIQLDREASHYVKQVLRMQVGQSLDIFNGEGHGEFRSVIVKFHGKEVEVYLGAFNEGVKESPVKITLAQAISRGEKMDFTLQKAVELGVHAIVPLTTSRVGVKLDEARAKKRLAHWQKIVVSACEQSGRNFVPVVSEFTEFATWVKEVNAELKLLLDPHKENELSPEMSPSEVVLLVGPEGGFSQEERELAYQVGFMGWKLGPRILRTETAGMSAIALLQFMWGDLM